MHDPNFILFLDVGLAAWTAFDLRRALVTGRARSRSGTVTREHQPGPYWRHVYSNKAVLAYLCGHFCGNDVMAGFLPVARPLGCRRAAGTLNGKAKR
jgi:hypothetical protein